MRDLVQQICNQLKLSETVYYADGSMSEDAVKFKKG
jgi:hypothetical protein